MKYLKVKNWEQFQHFKDRRPPWIKLYKDLLDDYLFHSLPVESRALAPMLWLMASEHEPLGTIKHDIKMISFRLRMTEKEVEKAINPLINNGLFTLDTSVISSRYQDDTPEKEIEGEVEEKKEIEKEGKNFVLPLPEWLPLDDWNDYLESRNKRGKKATNRAKQLVIIKLDELRTSGNDPGAVLRQSIENSWTSVFKLKQDNQNGNKTGFAGTYRSDDSSSKQPISSNRDRLMSAIFKAGNENI